jgi:hypothetical protein
VIDAFFATPVGQAVVVIALLATLDFFIGVFAAIRDDVFTFDAIAAWVRKTLLGRIAPIFGTLVVGYVAGGLAGRWRERHPDAGDHHHRHRTRRWHGLRAGGHRVHP